MNKVSYWILRVIAAVIMMQTLYFKFTASDESVYIFTQAGMEPWGRIGIGVMELIASILLLVNATVWMGAFIALGLMMGAIGMHLTLLGIEVKGDGGYLFSLAVVVALCSVRLLWADRHKIIKRFNS